MLQANEIDSIEKRSETFIIVPIIGQLFIFFDGMISITGGKSSTSITVIINTASVVKLLLFFACTRII